MSGISGITRAIERYDPVSPAIRGLAHKLTPQQPDDTTYQFGSDPHQGLIDYIKSNASAMDPRTKAGLVNLATILIPGRMGRMTQTQKAFLDQLRFDPNRAERGGLTPEQIASPANDLSMMGEHLGHTYGNPLVEMLFTGHGNMGARSGLDQSSGAASRTARFMIKQGVVSPQSMSTGEYGLGNPLASPSQQQLLTLLAKSAIQRRN